MSVQKKKPHGKKPSENIEGGELTPLETKCPDPKPTGGGTTPNGTWECKNGAWTWVPSIG